MAFAYEKRRSGIELNTNEARSGWEVDGIIIVTWSNAACAPTVNVVTVVVVRLMMLKAFEVFGIRS